MLAMLKELSGHCLVTSKTNGYLEGNLIVKLFFTIFDQSCKSFLILAM